MLGQLSLAVSRQEKTLEGTEVSWENVTSEGLAAQIDGPGIFLEWSADFTKALVDHFGHKFASLSFLSVRYAIVYQLVT
ncbi:MAG: hypothetical protein IPH75_14830 [bacterium]|nr:hypothetical protein [bacterium]